MSFDSSIGSSESLSSFKSEFTIALIDLDTPQSPRKIRGLVLEGFIDGSQNAVWR